MTRLPAPGRTALLTSALAASLLATPASAFEIDAMSDSEREAFGVEIREYLLENPEVIMEAVAVLERRQAAEQVANDGALVATNHDAIFNDGYSHVAGNPEGDITLVEFVDYKCGYCRKAFPEVNALIQNDGNIRMIYKEFPILGPESITAARFAIATQLVAGEEAYAKLHDAMMTMRGNLTDETLTGLADKLELDGAAIAATTNDPRVDEILTANMELAGRLQISGTPTFVMEDQLLRGYVPLDAMEQIVSELREKKG